MHNHFKLLFKLINLYENLNSIKIREKVTSNQCNKHEPNGIPGYLMIQFNSVIAALPKDLVRWNGFELKHQVLFNSF